MVDWTVIGQDAIIVLTLFLLEAVLSFDNAAALAAYVRRLPIPQRRKALLYGLVGAYVLRFTAILLAAFLIRVPELKIIGGGYLVYVFARHFYDLAMHRNRGGQHEIGQRNIWMRLGIPAFWATVIQIELLDLAFAIDQVIVAVAFTDKIVLIVIAAFAGILFLRLAAAFLARVMDWLPVLEHMAFIAVGIVGVKLMLLYWKIEIPTVFSISLTLSLFGIPVLLKLLFGIPASEEGHAGQFEQDHGKP